ncbi:MAG: T9SS type A sorting domain-containing protein [Bacteroidetes bacterium]|nr:MAG: T9SS type A sorting domain-containing protein [Bacteroidota bacterium]
MENLIPKLLNRSQSLVLLLFLLTSFYGLSGGTANILNSSSLSTSTTVCQGSAAPSTSAAFTVGCGGGGSSASTVTVSWYYNTTGSSGTLAGSTLLLQTTGVSTGTSSPVTYTLTSGTPSYNALMSTPGTYYIFCVITTPSNTACAGDFSEAPLSGTLYSGNSGTPAVRPITVVAPPTTSSNGGNQTLGMCVSSTTLTGNTPTSGTGTWTYTTAPAGGPAPTYSPSANSPGATVSGLGMGYTYTFTWTIANAPCTASTSNMTVTTTPGPGCAVYCNPSMAVGSATSENITNVTFNTINNNSSSTAGYENFYPGTSTNVLAGQTYNLSVSGYSIYNGTGGNPWRTACIMAYFDWNGDGDFNDAGEAIQVGQYNAASGIQTVNTNVTIPGGALAGYNMQFRIVLLEGPCPVAANSCPVSSTEGQAESYGFYVLPCLMNTPNAGPNQNLANCVTTATMAANTITNGTGSWSLVSGSGNITDPSSPTTTITNLDAGNNVFQWVGTPTVVGCPILTSNITITTNGVPSVAYAGPDAGSCSTTQTMAATAPTGGSTGTWSLISGTGSATSPNSPTSTITGLSTGANVWQWTVTNAACPGLSSTDQVTISVASAVTPANAGPDQSGICWNATYPGVTTLDANSPVIGTGAWTINSNTTGGSLSSTTNPYATISGINATGSITLTWTISSPGCSSSTDQVTITTINCNGDEPCTALGLPVNSGTCSLSTFNNTGMTVSTGMPEPGCAVINGPDMWFAVTVPASGQVQISSTTAGTFDELISIYDGPCGNLSFAGCVNGSGSNAYPLTYAGAPGSTIYVRVNEGGTGDAATGNFQICAYEATTANVSQVLPGVTTTVTCGSTLNFYDTGGQGGTTSTSTSQPPPAGNYTNNTGTTWKICPSDPSQYVTISFSQFLVENGFDKMIISTDADDVIAQWTYNQGAGDVVSAQNPGECLIVYFQSDYSYTALGWEAVVSCQSSPVASQITNESQVNNCTGNGGVWVCADGTYDTQAGAGAGIDEINEVTGGCWGAAGEVATSWFYFTTLTGGEMAFEFIPSNNGHNINFALYGPSLNGVPPCPTQTGDAPIRCSFATAGGINTGLQLGQTDLYDIATGNGMAAPVIAGPGETYALVVDVYQNGQPPTQTQIDFTGVAALDCTVLPIELISFDGINQGESNLLTWIVASQINNDYFTIERSLDGLHWEIVGTVDGAGTTQHNLYYTLEDPSPYFPVTYYRLKQTDFDGKGKYSDIVSVSNIKGDGNDFITDLFPNPTSEYATFSYSGHDTKTPLTVQVVNTLGEVVSQMTYTNVYRNMPATLITSDLSKGVYQVRFVQGDMKVTKKLSIIR